MPQFPYVITIWHASFETLGVFADEYKLGDNLVTVLPDTETRGLWAVYCVNGDQRAILRSIPRLTWR